ncbi:MAG: phage tail protein [Pseudomonadota bacterium]
MKRAVLRAALVCSALTIPCAAHADPISVTILAAIGTQTATALAVSAVTFALTTAASIVMTKLFAPKRNGQDRQASVASLSVGENPREALFGEAATGGSLADAFNYGGTDGTDWEVLIVDVADHRCHSLTGFFVNDVYVPFGGDGPVAGYNGQLEVYWLPGTEDQVMPSIVTSYGGWEVSDNLAGCATVVVAYKADSPKAKRPIWTAGRPNFLWVVKGKLCYQARLDSTVGGSGTHRWDNPATWAWTDNPIDCRYNWMRGVYACDRIDQPGMLLVGRGLSAIEAPPERVFSAANVCDESVALKAGGSEKRYRFNGVIRADEPFIDTEEMFAATCAGIIVQRQGGVEVEPGAARPVVAELTDADFIVGEPKSFNRYKSDTQRINSVVPRYIEPAQKWADHAAPLRRVLADLVEDGGPREDPLTLSAVTSNTQAQRCGEIRRRTARKERNFSGTLGPRFAHLEEGDWIGFTSARHFKGERHIFRINSYSLPASWRNTISIEEISADCFDWNPATDEIVPGAVAQQQAPPTMSAPQTGDWSVTGTQLTSADGSIPALVIVGASLNVYVDQIVFEYRLAGGSDDDWMGTDVAAPSVTRREITSIAPNTAYEAGVSYVIAGVPTDRLVLGPVTAGNLAAGSASNAEYVGDYDAAALADLEARIAALEP